MAALLALLLTIAPPASPTGWMTLQSFHLTIGMPRAEALAAVRAWNPKEGKNANEVFVDYSSDKALTLEFEKDRLKAVRFELFVFMPHLRKAFDEQRALLQKSFGDPRKATKSILIYDAALPNVMVVAADDPKSTHGKKGLGVLAVRYFDPR
jgi:hypothetical protein